MSAVTVRTLLLCSNQVGCHSVTRCNLYHLLDCEVLFSAVLIYLVCVCPALGMHRKSPVSMLFVVVLCPCFSLGLAKVLNTEVSVF